MSSLIQDIAEDVLAVSKKFQKENRVFKKPLTRDYYVKHGKFQKYEIEKAYGSFTECIEKVLPPLDKKREDFDIFIEDRSNKGKRFYVTALVAGQKLDTLYMESVLNYCKIKNARLVLLLMRGVSRDDGIAKEIEQEYGQYFCTEFVFNDNLRALDFLLLPQQIISTTGLDRLGEKGESIIVASTKIFLETVPSQLGEYPHFLYTTGCCTEPNYRNDRIGRIAKMDHTKGGLIIEVVDKKIFHIRNVECDDKHGFVDLGIYYNGSSIKKCETHIMLGDSHFSEEDVQAHETAKEIIKELEVSKVYFNDIFNCSSVSHWLEDNIVAKAFLSEHQTTLKKELDYVGKCVNAFTKDLKNCIFVSVPSNHNEHLLRYLQECKFAKDSPDNITTACEILPHVLKGEDPIEWYFNNKLNIYNILFPTRIEPINSFGISVIHGDVGSNGAKGSLRGFDKSYSKSVSANAHSPAIFHSSYRVGCLCKYLQYYNAKGCSSWLHNVGLLNFNGTVQLVNIIEGNWRLKEKSTKKSTNKKNKKKQKKVI
jgi:hypothetical protein